MLLFIILLPIFLIYLKHKSVVSFLLFLLILSLVGTFFIGRELSNMNFKLFVILITTTIFLLLIILPWNSYKNVTLIIQSNDSLKFKRLVKFLIIINSFTFIILLTTTIIVQITIEDINIFKYGEDVAKEFYATELPFNYRYIILTSLIYGFSYFMLPLHLYFLSIKNYKLSIICFILSLNIILKGSIYFSRYVIIEYAFLYFALFLILKNTIPLNVLSLLKKVAFIFVIILTVYFISISNDRFKDSKIASYNIPQEAKIKDPVLFSFIDYLSQWYFNSTEVLLDYELENFQGKITFEQLNDILGNYNITSYKSKDYYDLRKKLWKDNWYTFTGFTAYTIYDYGFLGGFIFCLSYFLIVQNRKPRNNKITIKNLFLTSLLIQVPLMSIFYSQIGSLLFPILFYLTILLYLKIKLKILYVFK